MQRYHPLAIFLHWVMAISFLLMLASGLIMTNVELDKSLIFRMYQWHKSLGVLLLCAFVLRLSVRLLVPHPPLPDTMKPFEKKAANIGHWGLYLWMLIVPLTGWIVVSSSSFGLPTIVFGWFEWPHIPGIAGNKVVEESAANAHQWLAYIFIALIGGHVAAVIKHAIFKHENLLPRMGIGRIHKEK